jgi:hypothetical protein
LNFTASLNASGYSAVNQQRLAGLVADQVGRRIAGGLGTPVHQRLDLRGPVGQSRRSGPLEVSGGRHAAHTRGPLAHFFDLS